MKGRRYFVISFIIMLFACAVIGRLFFIQIVKGSQYLETSHNQVVKTTILKAPRGEIYDRYGRPLVKNRMAVSVQISRWDNANNVQINEQLSSLIQLIRKNDPESFVDTFPVTLDASSFTFENDAKKEKEYAWKEKYEVPKNATPKEAVRFFAKRFEVANAYEPLLYRQIIGLRYEMELRGFSASNPFTLASDISGPTLAILKERSNEFPFVDIVMDTARDFSQGSLAAHVLGRIGKISSDEYTERKDSGYSMNDMLGKQGLEKYLEDYLRGTDGVKHTQRSGSVQVNTAMDQPSIPGNNATLTLDIDLQRVAENALADTINNIRGGSPDGKGWDAAGGSVIAMNPNTAEVLAIASYPSYDPLDFQKNYSQLVSDETRPLFNRAVGGLYAPGSVFKPLTAVAALETGVITPNDVITCQGVYTYYKQYQPKCWIYDQGGAHGPLSVSHAIGESCNYFFYDVGRRLTIEKLDDYAVRFGFGEATGIELPGEEASGRIAGPKDREAHPKDGDTTWYPGDTLQAAIGQSDHLFTPIQIANYVCTLVNGGKRYQPTLIRHITSSEDGRKILENEPKLLDTVQISDVTKDTVLSGMHLVASEGTAREAFEDFDISIGAKTGTAQVGSGSSNGVFVSFAPFDNPQIVVVAVVEHAGSGGNCAPIAKAIMGAYLHTVNDPDDAEPSGQLLP